MSNLRTLKQKVEEMQAEIERLEAEWREPEPEIPVRTLCWFWDDDKDEAIVDLYELDRRDGGSLCNHNSTAAGWKHARIANDIPGAMVWEKHDGGPCPVDVDALTLSMQGSGISNWCRAGQMRWASVTAYAIINKAEWMK